MRAFLVCALPALLAAASLTLLAGESAGEPAVDPAGAPPAQAPAESPFPKLFEGIHAGDAAVRELSLKALLKELGPQIEKSNKPYLKQIAAGIHSEKPEERAAALAAWEKNYAATIKYNKEAVGAVLNRLGAPDPATREGAQTAFVSVFNLVAENAIIDAQIEALASTDPAQSAAAVEKLKAMGEDAAFNLVRALEDERMVVRRLSLEILKALGPKAKGVAGDLSFLLDSDDRNVRHNAAALLENLGPDAADSTDDLVDYLTHDEKSVRRAAANILKKVGPAAAGGTSGLVDLLTEDDRNTRALATDALVAIGPAAAEDGVEPLTDIVKDPGIDDDAKGRALRALVAIGGASKPALPEIKKLAAEAKDPLKAAATDAAAKIEAAPAPPPKPPAEYREAD